MKDFSKRLAGQIGEHLVVAELGRREIIATPFAGNVPDIDILAYANGHYFSLGRRIGHFGFSVRKRRS